MYGKSVPFWRSKRPFDMSREEWESLCDGCARCCLHKLEDERTGTIHYTCIVCRYLDCETCQCTCYPQRTKIVPTCLQLTPETFMTIRFLPDTCAYRLIAEGKELAWWHPLVSGTSDTVHEAGISIRGKVLSEDFVHPLDWERMIIDWVR
ncbi:MAG: YcgN family cysteine cluster protein [Desulfobacterota bacterium]|nr:YcgN family cysteine cluster protein [Thermodesulfobacteriota bacterium]